jgi:AAA15 family ATPase/GTPase
MVVPIKLHKIVLENVKSFRDKTEVSFDKDMNIFIGSNRSGKSNLLDTIVVLLKREIIYNWSIQETNQGNPLRKMEVINLQRLFDPPNLYLEKYYGREADPQKISVSLLVTDEDIKGMNIARENIEKLRETEASIFYNSHNTNTVRIDEPLPSANDIITIDIVNWGVVTKIQGEISSYLTYTRNYELLTSLVDRYNQRGSDSDKIESLPPLFQYFPPNRDTTFGSEEVELSKLKRSEVAKEFSKNTSRSRSKTWDYISYYISKKMRHAGDDPDRFCADPEIRSLNEVLLKLGYSGIIVQCVDEDNNGYVIKTKIGNLVLPPYSMSSGEREILNILFSVYAFGMKNGLLIVDEPEIHIHITWQKQMLLMLEEVQKQRNLQMIMVTHSPSFVTMETLDKTFRVYLEDNISKIVRFDDTGNTILEKDVYRIINNLGFQYILFAEKVVLVEGQTDRLIFKSILELFRIDNPGSSISDVEVIDVGGKTSFNKFKSILEAFKIRTSIIADLDYIYDLPQLSRCLQFDANKALSKMKEKNSLDGERLFKLLDYVISKGNDPIEKDKLEGISEFLQYLRRRYTSLDERCAQEKDAAIKKCENDNIYVLAKGEIETYFGIDHKFQLEEALNTFEGIISRRCNVDSELIGIAEKIFKK